jgi:hypothetical protein
LLPVGSTAVLDMREMNKIVINCIKQRNDLECYFEMQVQKARSEYVYIYLYVFCKQWYVLEVLAFDG